MTLATEKTILYFKSASHTSFTNFAITSKVTKELHKPATWPPMPTPQIKKRSVVGRASGPTTSRVGTVVRLPVLVILREIVGVRCILRSYCMTVAIPTGTRESTGYGRRPRLLEQRGRVSPTLRALTGLSRAAAAKRLEIYTRRGYLGQP